MTFGHDAYINPLLGDYDGQVIDNLANALYLRVTVPLGSYWADPSFGSKLHFLRREKDLPSVRLLAEQYVRQALQPLLDAGRADRIDVQVSDAQSFDATSRLPMQVDVYQHGEVAAQLTHHVPVMQI